MKIMPRTVFWVVVIIVVMLTSLMVVNFLAGGVDTITQPKYTVHVYGKVHYDALTGWSLGDVSKETEKEGLLSLLWFRWPWQTGDVLVKGILYDSKHSYEAEVWIDKLNIIYSDKSFALDFKHVVEGTYNLSVKVYEGEKKLVGTSNMVLQVSKTTSISVP